MLSANRAYEANVTVLDLDQTDGPALDRPRSRLSRAGVQEYPSCQHRRTHRPIIPSAAHRRAAARRQARRRPTSARPSSRPSARSASSAHEGRLLVPGAGQGRPDRHPRGHAQQRAGQPRLLDGAPGPQQAGRRLPGSHADERLGSRSLPMESLQPDSSTPSARLARPEPRPAHRPRGRRGGPDRAAAHREHRRPRRRQRDRLLGAEHRRRSGCGRQAQGRQDPLRAGRRRHHPRPDRRRSRKPSWPPRAWAWAASPPPAQASSCSTSRPSARPSSPRKSTTSGRSKPSWRAASTSMDAVDIVDRAPGHARSRAVQPPSRPTTASVMLQAQARQAPRHRSGALDQQPGGRQRRGPQAGEPDDHRRQRQHAERRTTATRPPRA